jgi:hypothetical protein
MILLGPLVENMGADAACGSVIHVRRATVASLP